MATIGPSITISSIGPGGTREIGFSNFFVVGQTPWGIDNTWTLCDSFQTFLRKFGGLSKLPTVAAGTTADVYGSETNAAVTLPYYAVKAYFQEKQSNSPGILYFCRGIATSSGPTAANKTFADVTGSNNTTITGKSKGLAGSTVQITVTNPSPNIANYVVQPGTVTTNGTAAIVGVGTSFAATDVGKGFQVAGANYTVLTFTDTTHITITPNAAGSASGQAFSYATPTCTIKAYFPQPNITEYWDIANANDAANASKKSELITIALPAGGQVPATAAASKLASGTVATADSYAATDADLIGTTTAAGVKTGLQVFNDQKLGSGFVAVPGKYTSTIRSGIATHCATYFREGILGAPSALNLTTVVTDLAAQNGPDLAYYWPQLWVQDDGSSSGSGQILVDNVGHIAGLHARMDRDYKGPQKSAAGITHPLTSAIDVERASGSYMELCDDAGSGTLADSLINTIRIKGNPGGVVVWGMRTLSQDNRYRQVPVRRILQLIYLTTFLTLEGYTFEPFDPWGRLFGRLRGDLNMFLENLLRNGTLYGNSPGKDVRPDDAYYVVCDKSNNPGPAIANGELHVDVQFVPGFNAEKVTENLSLVIPGFVGRAQ